MKIKFLLASVAMLAVATPAMAQDTVEAFQGGARVEVRGAVDNVRGDIEDGHATKTGFGYGVEAGYDLPLSSIVIGGYVGIEGSTAKKCVYDLGDEACLKTGRNFTAGVRVGGTVGNGLLYAKGGYSNGRVRLTYDEVGSNLYDFAVGRNLDGFHLGAGYELNIRENVYVKAEYVYTNYQSNHDLGFKVDSSRNQGVIGVGYRF